MAAMKMQLAYFLLIMCVIGSIECGVVSRHKRNDESEEKEPEEVPTTEAPTEVPTESSSGKYPFIPDNVQAWFKEVESKFPGGGPNKWFEQAGSMGSGNKWMEEAGSFFSKGPWAKTEK